MNPTLAEQELYDRLNDYRTQLKADSLTPFDIQQFMRTCHIHDIEPRKIYSLSSQVLSAYQQEM